MSRSGLVPVFRQAVIIVIVVGVIRPAMGQSLGEAFDPGRRVSFKGDSRFKAQWGKSTGDPQAFAKASGPPVSMVYRKLVVGPEVKDARGLLASHGVVPTGTSLGIFLEANPGVRGVKDVQPGDQVVLPVDTSERWRASEDHWVVINAAPDPQLLDGRDELKVLVRNAKGASKAVAPQSRVRMTKQIESLERIDREIDYLNSSRAVVGADGSRFLSNEVGALLAMARRPRFLDSSAGRELVVDLESSVSELALLSRSGKSSLANVVANVYRMADKDKRIEVNGRKVYYASRLDLDNLAWKHGVEFDPKGRFVGKMTDALRKELKGEHLRIHSSPSKGECVIATWYFWVEETVESPLRQEITASKLDKHGIYEFDLEVK